MFLNCTAILLTPFLDNYDDNSKKTTIVQSNVAKGCITNLSPLVNMNVFI